MSGTRKAVGVRMVVGVLAVGAFATLGFPGVAVGTHTNSPSPAPYQDSLWGTADFCAVAPGPGLVCAQFHSNAKSEFTGSSPEGTVFAHLTVVASGVQADLHGRVTCLTVGGNQAVVGAEVTSSSNPAFVPEGAGLFAQVVDNGEPGTDPAAPDRAFGGAAPTPPAVCPPPVFPTSPITQGNYVVHDAVVGQ